MMHQTARGHKRRSRGLLVFLGFVLLCGFLIFSLYQNIQKSIFWNRNWRTTLTIQSDPLVVVSFPVTDTDETLIVTIPANVYITVPYGYGPYRIGAVPRLGELEKKPDLFRNAVEDFLGVPVNGVIDTEQKQLLTAPSNEQLLSDLKHTFSFSSVVRHRFGDLHFLDRLLFVWKIQQLNPKTVSVVISENSPQIYINTTLPDGTAIKLLDKQGLERFFEQKFEDTETRLDGLLVKVFNTTSQPGVGQKFARFITNFGGKVVSVDNFVTQDTHCSITVAAPQLQKKLVRFLEKEMGCTVSTSSDQLDADVVVYVGDSFAKRWVEN